MCMGSMCHFSCDVNVVIVIDIFGKWIMAFSQFILYPSWCCALFCLRFLVHMLWSVVPAPDWYATCSVNVLIVINFVEKLIMVYWKLIVSDLLTTTFFIYPLHVVFLQYSFRILAYMNVIYTTMVCKTTQLIHY